MFVGVCRVEIHIHAAESLKDKRGVIQSVASRIRNQFSVSVAEIESQDNHHLAVLGIAAVSNQAGHADEIVRKVAHFLDQARLDAEVGLVEFDVLSAF